MVLEPVMRNSVDAPAYYARRGNPQNRRHGGNDEEVRSHKFFRLVSPNFLFLEIRFTPPSLGQRCDIITTSRRVNIAYLSSYFWGEEEKTTRIFFQPGKLLTTNSLEPAIWRNMYYGYRDDVPKANPLHPNYVVEVLPTGKTVFLDSDIPKTFASIVQMAWEEVAGNTRFGMPTVYQVKEKSKSFMFRHDAQEQREDDSWIFKGLEQWPSSFIATIDFWPDEEFVCSFEPSRGRRKAILDAGASPSNLHCRGWALKPTVHWPKEDNNFGLAGYIITIVATLVLQLKNALSAMKKLTVASLATRARIPQYLTAAMLLYEGG
ncbi:hypothetical protein CPB84DRAFT_1745166 [Gymnopilus junonius]|uniref:Uncharacterized protein n=1 Tax=Gymnopilus junonius TaxID=109634 RepID=A0A9P5NTK7_GYMJU|nr:hypothetical protein CPB84DRAFT_1745166 [Gymnopilus junonius]